MNSHLAGRHAATIYPGMQSENPLIADFVKMMNSAAGTFAGMTREARESARERAKEFVGGMDFVAREEFDAVKDMAVKAQDAAEALKARIDELEVRMAASAGGITPPI